MKRGWLFFGLLALVILAAMGTGALVYSSRPGFCANCHEMLPEYNTWQASNHAKIGCAACHTAAQPTNLLHKAESLKQVWLHVTGIPRQIEIHGTIENSICLNCHVNPSDFTSTHDVKVPHVQHVSREVICVDCHAEVVHAGIAVQFPELAPDSPKKALLAAGMEAKAYRPAMETCFNCHEQKQVNVTCLDCHSEGIKPESHPERSVECIACHRVDHPSTWIKEHPATVQRQGMIDCFSCHDAPTCTACHIQQGVW